jgi:hypothetical protein
VSFKFNTNLFRFCDVQCNPINWQLTNSARVKIKVSVDFWGKYSLLVTNDILQSMREGNKIYVSWNKDEKKVNSYCLDSQLVRVLLVKLENLNVNDFLEGYLIEGYTRAMTKTTEGNKIIFYAHPSFQGKRW